MIEVALMVNMVVGYTMTPYLLLNYIRDNNVDIFELSILLLFGLMLGGLFTPIAYVLYKFIEFLEE
jgi:predicted permease